MKLRHGFKTEAEGYAVEFRMELQLEPHAPLNPWDLADLLCVPVIGVSEHPAIDDGVKRHFTKRDSRFSAATICDGTYREIILNDSKHLNRQRSSLTHEIAHIVLGHPPKPPLTEDACRRFDPQLEFEANELGFTLLVPKRAALHAVENFASLNAASEQYGVSLDLMKYRVRITNAAGWAKNRKRAYG